MSITKKVSVKVLAVLCAVVCLVGCVLPVSASAGFISDYITGDWTDQYTVTTTNTITLDEAKYGLCTYLGITNAKLEASGLQVWASTSNQYAVEVWEDGNLAEVIYKDDNGYICGLTTGFMVLSDDVPSGGGGGLACGDDLDGVITTVSTGVGGVFDMSVSAFDFITSNDLCMLMLSISFAGIAVAFVGRSFKTARK